MSNTNLVESAVALTQTVVETRSRPVLLPPLPVVPLVSQQPLTVFNLMLGLRRSWKSAVGVGLLLSVVATALVWLFLPPVKPSAFTKIYFLPVSERTRYERSDPPLKEQTQKELILSRLILGKVMQRSEVAELEFAKEKSDPLAWLAKELIVEFPQGSDILKISMVGDKPEESQVVVNAVKDTYLQENEKDRAERETRLLLGLAKAQLEYNLARQENTQKHTGLGTGDPQTIAYKQRRIEEQVDSAEADLKTARLAIQKLQREIQAYNRKMSEPIDVTDGAYEPIFLSDDEVVVLSKQRKELDRKLAERKRIVAADHPSINDVEREVKNNQAKLNERKVELRPYIETRIRSKLDADLAKAKDDLAAAESQEQTSLSKIEKLKADSAVLTSATLNVEGTSKDLIKLKAKVDEYELALEKVRDAQEAPRAKTLEEGTIVRPNEAARKTKIAAATFVGIFGLTLLGFAFSEYRTRRIVSPAEVTCGLGMPVMGTVPVMPSRIGRSASSGTKAMERTLWEHILNESVDSARTLFLHTADANALRIVLITSAVGGEGKTSLSCQLAKSLARSGRQVLLIDGDLRSPSIHTQFGSVLVPGVCEYLRGELPLPGVVRQTEIANLFILKAGQCETKAIQQLAMDGFRRLIEEVRGHFDFVLIDSSPVLPVADALLMARCVDGVILSLMCDVSQVERVQAACQKLASIGTRVIGAVVHGTTVETYGYGYGR